MQKNAMKLTPPQQKALDRLKDAIDGIFANGMGIHAIAAALDNPTYVREGRGLREDLSSGTGHELEHSPWCVKADPFRTPRPEDSIV